MQVYPTKLTKLDDQRELLIAWSDGQQRRYAFAELRKGCPCASCREQRKQDEPPPDANLLPIITSNEAAPLDVLGMTPVGNYAYSISFSDGHDTGIFSFELLRELGAAETA